MKKALLIIGLLMAYLVGMTATQNPAINFNNGVYHGLTMFVEDPYFVSMTQNNITTFSVGDDKNLKNYIRLEVDPTLLDYEDAYEALDLDIIATSFDQNNNVAGSERFWLKVSHDPTANSPTEIMRAYQELSNPGYRIELEILNIKKNHSIDNNFSPQNVRLYTEIHVDRFFTIDYNSSVSNIAVSFLNAQAQSKNLRVSWNPLDGADEYDLEWVHVTNLDGTSSNGVAGHLANTDITYSFKNNADRVRISDLSYEFPMIYGEGYVLYRVRGVHTDKDGHVSYSRWSMGDNYFPMLNHPLALTIDDLINGAHGGAANYNTNYFFHVTSAIAHEQEKNWQLVSSFAEDGKRKDVISYYDGSMRSRQMVTRMNTSGQVIAGETVYDYQGRPGVNILPAPLDKTQTTDLSFKELLNQNISGDPYSWKNFDQDGSSTCLASVGTISNLSGAGKYYSSASFDTDGAQAYVPNANGYPFSHTEYEPDNTGRIRRQSGVGDEHTIGSGHETRYFYSTPTQEELDRLFGSEVGNAIHYKKNLVIDANGQGSVSYLDPAGRVIATAIVGETPSNVDQLASATSYVQSDDLVEYSTFGTDNSLTILRDFVVTKSTNTYTLQYSVNPAEYAPACGSNCYDGNFLLDLHLYNECGEDILDNSIYSSDQSYTQLPIGDKSDLRACTTGDDNWTKTITLTDLPVGKYRFVKKLKVDAKVMEDYWQQYLNTACAKTLEYFKTNADTRVSIVGCEVDCQECLSSLPDETTFIADGGTAQEYYLLRLECEDLCEEFETPCEAIFNTLKMDVSPGGQYAKVSYNADGEIIASTDPHSLFYESTSFTARWRTIEIVDVDDNPIYIQQVNGWPEASSAQYVINGKVEPRYLKNVSDYIQLWDDQWAGQIALAVHPEAPYVNWCQSIPTLSDDYYYDLISTDSYYDAYSSMSFISNKKLYIGTTINWNNAELIQILDNDPYFTSSNFGGTILNAYNGGMTGYNIMKQWILDYDNQGVSMYEVAALTVLAPTYSNASSTPATSYRNFGNASTSADNDLMWQRFRDMYLAKRSELITAMGLQHSSSSYSVASGKQPRVIKAGDTDFNQAAQEAGMTYDPEKMKQDYLNKANMYHYLSTGQCPIARDIEGLINQVLSSQNGIPTSLDISNSPALSPDLVDLFSTTTPGIYPNYKLEGSTINTNDLQIIITNLSSNTQVFKCTIPDFFLYHVSGVSTVTELAHWREFSSTSTSGTFELTLRVDHDNDNATLPIEHHITGASFSLLALDNCASTANAYCTTNTAGKMLQNIIAEIIESNNSMFSLSTSEFTNDLREYVDVVKNSNTWFCSKSGAYHYISDGHSSNRSYKIEMLCTLDYNIYDYYLADLKPTTSTATKSFFELRIVKTKKSDGTKSYINAYSYIETIGTGATYLPISKCGADALCEQKTQASREKLQYLLNDLAPSIPASTGTYNDNNLHTRETFSHLLIDQLGFSTYKLEMLNNDTPIPDQLEIKIIHDPTGANIQVAYLNLRHTGTPTLNFDDITSFDALRVEGRVGDEFKISIVASDASNNVYYLEGETNIEISNCDFCSDDQGKQVIHENFDDGTFAGTIQMTPFDLNGNYNIGNTFSGPNLYYISKSAHSESNLSIYDRNAPGQGAIAVYGATLDEVNLWQMQNVPVTPDKKYTFNLWFKKVGNESDDGNQIKLSVNDGTNTTSQLFSFDDQGVWLFAELEYYSANASSVDLSVSLDGGNNNQVEFEVGIDDIKFYRMGCSGEYIDIQPLPTFDYMDNCEEEIAFLSDYNALKQYQAYIQDLHLDFKQDYIQSLLNNTTEVCTISHTETEYHYTLYYYDQAGNLRRTVPPAGVNPENDDADLIKIRNDRDNNKTGSDRTYYTNHSLATSYEYNSLNQLVTQRTPDGGISNFWYDKLGRLVVSQNAEQALYNRYSYTLYDELGRISEVAQLTNATAMTNTTSADDDLLSTWITQGAKTEVTKTYYDFYKGSSSYANNTNLRGRVAEVTYDRNPNDYAEPDHKIKYEYDIHGNVKKLTNENRFLHNTNTNLPLLTTSVEYQYDLLSGNVNKVLYQNGQQDQFFHRYTYDADNRILQAYTSNDNLYWDRDAEYTYYDHGPLARVEIGHNTVQGLDYAYTIQGWLKGVNSDAITADNDMGRDGKQNDNASGSYLNASPNAHAYVPEDIYGFSLGYFNGDYSATGSGAADFVSVRPGDIASAAGGNNLYNGNISNMVTSLTDEAGKKNPHLNAYAYDQLNRIKAMKVYDTDRFNVNHWDTYQSDAYSTSYSYDANGNITALQRKDKDNNLMDNLSYSYINNTNQLQSVTDASSSAGITTDFEGASNYSYDKIGNLVSDEGEEIKKIYWTVSGKVMYVERDHGSTKSDLEFTYDPMGNRVMKIERLRNTSGLTGHYKATWYARDAQGNVMATYSTSQNDGYNSNDLMLKDYSIYGSDRLGLVSINEKVVNLTEPSAKAKNFIRGQKMYELKNHLGNVLSTLTDRLIENRGNALEFDGSDDVVTIPNSSALQIGGDMTIEMWVRPDNFNSRQNPICKTYGGEFAITQEMDGKLNFFYGVSGHNGQPYQGLKSTVALNLNQWNHIAIVRDFTNAKVSWYINGVLRGTASTSFSYATTSSFPVTIGDGYVNPYDGEIDEVRIWNVARTASQIADSRYKTFKGNETGLAAFWNFNQTEGQVVYDLTSNTSNGYLGSTSGTQTNDPSRVNTSVVLGSFSAEQTSYSDYYPFGMEMPGRSFSSSSYRYGYQGSEKDNELKGNGSSYTTFFRQLDPRLGRWLSKDPKIAAWESPYVSMRNNPIRHNDVLGDWVGYHNKRDKKMVKTMAKNDKGFRKKLRKQRWSIFKYYEYHNVEGIGNDNNRPSGQGINLRDAEPENLGHGGNPLPRRGIIGFLFGKNRNFHIHYDHATFTKVESTDRFAYTWSSDGNIIETEDENGFKILTVNVPSLPENTSTQEYYIKDASTSDSHTTMKGSVFDSEGIYRREFFGSGQSRGAQPGETVVISPNSGANKSDYHQALTGFRLSMDVHVTTTLTVVYQINQNGTTNAL
jgi:RHS repeat-associated protein